MDTLDFSSKPLVIFFAQVSGRGDTAIGDEYTILIEAFDNYGNHLETWLYETGVLTDEKYVTLHVEKDMSSSE